MKSIPWYTVHANNIINKNRNNTINVLIRLYSSWQRRKATYLKCKVVFRCHGIHAADCHTNSTTVYGVRWFSYTFKAIFNRTALQLVALGDLRYIGKTEKYTYRITTATVLLLHILIGTTMCLKRRMDNFPPHLSCVATLPENTLATEYTHCFPLSGSEKDHD